MRKPRGRDERCVLYAHAVMDLVALLEAAQDRDRVLDRRLADVDRLEAPLERRVLLHVLAVLIKRGRADAAEVPPRERGLEAVRGVRGAFRGPRADYRVQLVDEEHYLAVGGLDLPEHRLHALLELAAELRAREERADIERDDALVLEPLGHVARDDAPREALGYGGLPDAGLADEHRVVLRPARKHLHYPAYLLVAAYYGIELPLAREVGEIAPVALEGLVLLFRRGVLDARAAADLGERLVERVGRDAGFLQDRRGVALVVLQYGEQEVLGR